MNISPQYQKAYPVYQKCWYLSTDNRDEGSSVENPIFTIPDSDALQQIRPNQYIQIQVFYVNILNSFYNITTSSNTYQFDNNNLEIPIGYYNIRELVKIINKQIQPYDETAKVTCNKIKQRLEFESGVQTTWTFSPGLAKLLGVNESYIAETEFHGRFYNISVGDLVIQSDIGVSNIVSPGRLRGVLQRNSNIAILSRTGPGQPFILQTKELKHKLFKGRSLTNISLSLSDPHGRPIKYYGDVWDIGIEFTIFETPKPEKNYNFR
jgi:hypothetical protein